MGFSILLFFFLTCFPFPSTEAYDPLDPTGNITIRWDVINWTSDGYVALVTMNNFQQYRHIAAPGWSLEWTWAKKEVIWNMVGAQPTEQGNCSKFLGNNIPHSCKKNPTVVDFLPSTPEDQKIPHCCKGGVLSSLAQDPTNAVASFQVTVGNAGTNNRTVRLPRNFTMHAPGPGYTCGPAKIVKPTQFITPDKRRITQALMTWNVTCTYSAFLAQKNPACCVSLSSFYNDTIVPCPTCSCGCQGNSSSCAKLDSPRLKPAIECSSHMCPVQVNWHVEANDKDYWRVKMNITNFNYGMKFPEWNLIVQHPNVNNLTQVSGFHYKGLTPYAEISETAMFWGIKLENDVLNQAGPSGNVEGELVFGKENSSLSLNKGWAFPQRIYFNGDNCVMPPAPDSNPPLTNLLVNASSRQQVSLLTLIMSCLQALFFYTFASSSCPF